MSIYQRIVNDLSAAIRTGQLKKGEKLPSVRQLSRDYQCSKDTVVKALAELKHQKDIYSVSKSGYYVLEGIEQEEELSLKLKTYNYQTYDYFRICLDETLKGRENYLFNYYHSQAGLDGLLKSLKGHLEERSVYAKEGQILVTAGSQQALYILSQIDFPNNKQTILLEQPTYHRMYDLVSVQNLPFLTISRDFSGLDLAELEAIFKRGDIKFFYTISRFSNPLGLTYNLEEKQAIIELAERYDVYILEDDYMGDFTKSSDLPLHYYDIHERVIYLKSFSMSIFPALRLGAVVLPESLKDRFLAYKRLIDYDTNLIMQSALSLYLDNGMFDQNIKRLRQHFQKEMSVASEWLTDYQLPYPYRVSPHFVVIAFPEEKMRNLMSDEQLSRLTISHRSQGGDCYLQFPLNEKLPKLLKKLT
ncbi:PLP-dependent aminotransferase family protein [Streptococcus plurextorum]|uniref:aminotransferase-like domain-containing protein n=1 Tax=Streptococcus plurextorum TaxID=456876 RepID=UPI00040BCBC6|nr:PLP-dependent aminotransferase family protein [Streptococcus plurextorum]